MIQFAWPFNMCNFIFTTPSGGLTVFCQWVHLIGDIKLKLRQKPVLKLKIKNISEAKMSSPKENSSMILRVECNYY